MLSNKLTLNKVAPGFFHAKRVLVRVDFNVPLDKKTNAVTNTQRITESLPTLRRILADEPTSLVLMSHLGRPNGERDPKASLRPVAALLESMLQRPVKFLDDCVGADVEQACASPPAGSIIMLENLRFHAEEEGEREVDKKKVKAEPAAVEQFRQSLQRLGDVYVNDAFGTAHRAHSSMVGIHLEPRIAGLLMGKELEYFGRVLENPQRPFLAILGGAKVEDKIQLIEALLDKVDAICIGGGMAFTFKKVLSGMDIGGSLFDAKGAAVVEKIVAKAKAKNVSLVLPVDFVAADKFAADAATKQCTEKEGIPDKWSGLECADSPCRK